MDGSRIAVDGTPAEVFRDKADERLKGFLVARIVARASRRSRAYGTGFFTPAFVDPGRCPP